MIGRPAWIIVASFSGMPISWAISWPISSWRSCELARDRGAQRDALGDRRLAPGRERLARRGDGALDVLGRALAGCGP